jgi:hypothetical protein
MGTGEGESSKEQRLKQGFKKLKKILQGVLFFNPDIPGNLLKSRKSFLFLSTIWIKIPLMK